MKILFSSHKNPYFTTITEYIEQALSRVSECLFFESVDFIFPGSLRRRISALEGLDLKRMNEKLLSAARKFKPDIYLEASGHRIFPSTVETFKKMGIKTVQWTIDPPREAGESYLRVAPCFDYCFAGGSETIELLKDSRQEKIHFLPFACDPREHYPVELTAWEKTSYAADIVFIGTVDPRLYGHRVTILEAISDFDLAVWGPGGEHLRANSPLRPHVRGGHIGVEEWRKIYSAGKIVLCSHYQDPAGVLPCYQASPRVYEALACGALLVVDAQKDVLTLFKDNQELVIFNSIDELRSSLKYYLKHGDEGKRIAEAGRNSVLTRHTYDQRVQTILEIIR